MVCRPAALRKKVSRAYKIFIPAGCKLKPTGIFYFFYGYLQLSWLLKDDLLNVDSTRQQRQGTGFKGYQWIVTEIYSRKVFFLPADLPKKFLTYL